MVQLQNSDSRYGAIALGLHWLMALVLTALLVSGLYMTALPDVGFNTLKIRLILYHKELGMLALALVTPRLLWRLANKLPHLAEALPDWQKVVARFVHLCFYALMFALPITGWLMSSAAAIPVSILGLFTLPDLVGRSDRLFRAFIDIHMALAYGLIACMLVHVGAALRHHFMLGDDTLKRMLPPRDR